MANTFTKIASATVGSGGAASIDFTSIPSTYTDLCVKISLRATNVTQNWTLTFNSSSSGYSQKVLYGDGSGSSSQSLSAQSVIYGYAQNRSDLTASVFNNGEIYIPNYAGSNNKSVSIDEVSENNATYANQSLVAGLWSNTSAITSISIGGYTGNLAQYSSATLYGIKNS
jgi:hypothetical protein